MPSLSSIVLLATTAFAAFVSASPVSVPDGAGSVNVVGRQVQSLTTILDTVTTQLQAVQAQVEDVVAGADGQAVSVASVLPQLSAVNDILTQAVAAVQADTTPLGLGSLTTVAGTLTTVVLTVVDVLTSVYGAVGSGNAGALTSVVESGVGATLPQLLTAVSSLGGAGDVLGLLEPVLSILSPLLAGVGLGSLTSSL